MSNATVLLIFVVIIVIATLACVKLALYLKNKAAKKKKIPLEEEILLLQNEIAILYEKKSTLDDETKDLQSLRKRENTINADIAALENSLQDIQKKIASVQNIEHEADEKIKDIRAKVDLYSRLDDYVEYGHYDMPQYLYETSDRYTMEIKGVREEQKTMIRDDTVIISNGDDDYPLGEKFFKKILAEQKKLMIRTFNIECDLLIEKVNPSNISRTLERIETIANNIEKSSADLRYGFNIDYIESKFEECNLQYQFTLKKREEQEEQKAIKEQMREEERARREYEKAIADAEKEEDLYQKMLEKAREALGTASEVDRAAAELRIQQLEEELKEAKEKAARAKSMAEQTRKGHVYVISNIGSFGENVYKIGLTRRLDPTERVKELGDASVPFSFDIHAMIYADDAPQLENALHKAFHEKRVNAVNLRKEFFTASLEEIKNMVYELVGEEAEFKTTILAEEYFQTKRLHGAQ